MSYAFDGRKQTSLQSRIRLGYPHGYSCIQLVTNNSASKVYTYLIFMSVFIHLRLVVYKLPSCPTALIHYIQYTIQNKCTNKNLA